MYIRLIRANKIGENKKERHLRATLNVCGRTAIAVWLRSYIFLSMQDGSSLVPSAW